MTIIIIIINQALIHGNRMINIMNSRILICFICLIIIWIDMRIIINRNIIWSMVKELKIMEIMEKVHSLIIINIIVI